MADSHQRHVIQEIIRIGRARRMPRQAILAALVTGSVESRFRNLKGGDRDSQGWRQERAQFYANPRNLSASINRFYDEWKADAQGRGLSVGQQAQAVQQSGFPDRYQTRLGLAKRLLAEGGGAPPVLGVSGTAPRVQPGGQKTDFGAALLDALLTNRGRPGLLGRAMQAADSGAYTTTTPPKIVGGKTRKYRVPGMGPGDVGRTLRPAGNHGRVLEVFYDPLGVYYDSGKLVKGAIGGHGNHVHVSASPRLVVALGRVAQRRGLRVSENPAFDQVDPVHTKGSFHYRRRAIDVSGDPRQMAAFARDVIRMTGSRV